MTNPQARLLVTTALEQTWGDDESIVFLGEWCRLYDRKEAWQKRAHAVIRNHWDDRLKNKKDYAYLKALHDSLLESLAEAMSLRHGISRPLRYWRMILDPWLVTYVPVVWDRWECLRLAFEENDRLETVALESDAGSKPCFDYTDFVENAINDRWNHRLYLDIIRSAYPTRCAVTEIAGHSASSPVLNTISASKPRVATLRRRLAELADAALGALTERNRAVFFDSFFPKPALVRLNLTLRQAPRLHLNDFDWPVALAGTDSPGVPSRECFRPGLTPRDAFEAFLFDRIGKDIPTSYVEGFASLLSLARRVRMKPRVILTANAHWHNELFKLWSAEQTLGGAKLVVMQHGGSIPIAYNTMDFEEDISDVRTVWTVPYHPKHKRLPANKLAAVRVKSSRETLAVVGLEVPRYSFRIEAAPVAGQALTSHEMSCELYSHLSPAVKISFLVKPFPNIGWNTRRRYIDRLGADKVSDERSYYRFLSRARVVVCTYPQTTFSEAMASGLPTTLLYPAGLWENIPEMDPLVEELRAAKIIFHDPTAAAAHINAVWDDPGRWWDSPEVLHARAEFERQALNLDGDWLRQWTSFIDGLAS